VLNRALELYDQRQLVAAEQHLHSLVKAKKTYNITPRARLIYAFCAYTAKQYDEALIRFTDVFQQHPYTAEASHALYHIGLCEEALDHRLRAIDAYSKLVKNRPYSLYAVHAAERLRQIGQYDSDVVQ
jgi:TolA-binding protein